MCEWASPRVALDAQAGPAVVGARFVPPAQAGDFDFLAAPKCRLSVSETYVTTIRWYLRGAAGATGLAPTAAPAGCPTRPWFASTPRPDHDSIRAKRAGATPALSSSERTRTQWPQRGRPVRPCTTPFGQARLAARVPASIRGADLTPPRWGAYRADVAAPPIIGALQLRGLVRGLRRVPSVPEGRCTAESSAFLACVCAIGASTPSQPMMEESKP